MAGVIKNASFAPECDTSEFDQALQSVLDGICTKEIIFFPVRHHSPACAWHIRKLILEIKPSSVLVEGPANFSDLIPLILNERTKAPFAVYTNFVDSERRIPQPETAGPDPGPARFAAYFPFCDYSPELVALRTGREAGADLAFIDLDYDKQVIAEHGRAMDSGPPKTQSLMAERYLQRSQYLAELARRTGCRDQNDLWDHLFEANFQSLPTNQFMRNVAAYCFIARQDASMEELEADGTLAREAAMANAIAFHVARRKGKKGNGAIVVVTGGFHTVALPGFVESIKPPVVPAQPVADEQAKVGNAVREARRGVLIRYSFDQLNALNGYSAGMPSPHYYDRLWQQFPSAAEGAYTSVAGQLIVEIGRLTREKKLQIALSPADEIAALQQARLLAKHRGHTGPVREDILDGIRSCFVKGAMEAEGAVLLGIAEHVFSGTAIGDVPPEAGVPPIIANFRTEAERLRLNIRDSIRKKTSLDIYRSENHRNVSRFLHQLCSLGVPFGSLVAGPDFVRGTGLERIHEHWDYTWSPRTESALVDVAIYGSTIHEAAVNRLKDAIIRLDDTGEGRSAPAAVAMLIRACRMGLHLHVPELLPLIAGNLAEDPSFASLVTATNQLLLLWQSREPLEAHSLHEVPELMASAYTRACYLIAALASCPDDETRPVMDALLAIREFVALNKGNVLDADLFWQSLVRLGKTPKCQPTIAGAVAGLVHGAGRLLDGELESLTSGYLGGTSGNWRTNMAFLQGLLHTCREVAWQNELLMKTVDQLLAGFDEADFFQALPEFRLCFAGLTPRETDKVGALVAGIHGKQDLGSLFQSGVTEGEFDFNRRVTALVLGSLREDHLEPWERTIGEEESGS